MPSADPAAARTPSLPRRDVLRAGLAATAAILAGCAASPTLAPGPSALASPSPAASPSPSIGPTPSPTPPTVPLREAIASLLVVGFRGMTVETIDANAAAVRHGLGGVILFSRDGVTGLPRNVTSPAQLRALTSGLRQLA
ncbi:MAG TPA: hypothetical protein VJ506_03490, partial [Candidatus Limnocylindrales bacterium]|nr:hypothetical protein [Candidatus Limnocylindrales bacterium]